MTLIELMVVVAILVILASVAAPSFRTFLATMNSKSVAFDLVGDLTFARAEAIKRNLPVTVSATGGDWAKGWAVATVEATPQSLRTRSALGWSIKVTSAASTVQFRVNGRLQDDVNDSNLNWGVESTISGVKKRCIVITPTGTARSKMEAC
ncbi:type IV fimbrial biogenesis protein FimT [Inhella inkyongensis]|uniref:Type II secretion system protein H n=2 Tax=Inhella inkyongensis TaxID=392593 RepID=A0A840S3J0_9BURK|nr:GspH/FimT family pseudopilin [Inhella inkyongensis]MBB5203616.1 type IV fimbrial biogenesis protein FimT [Inhella inkyongensis]